MEGRERRRKSKTRNMDALSLLRGHRSRGQGGRKRKLLGWYTHPTARYGASPRVLPVFLLIPHRSSFTYRHARTHAHTQALRFSGACMELAVLASTPAVVANSIASCRCALAFPPPAVPIFVKPRAPKASEHDNSSPYCHVPAVAKSRQAPRCARADIYPRHTPLAHMPPLPHPIADRNTTLPQPMMGDQRGRGKAYMEEADKVTYHKYPLLSPPSFQR